MLLLPNRLQVFDHLVGLALKGLNFMKALFSVMLKVFAFNNPFHAAGLFLYPLKILKKPAVF